MTLELTKEQEEIFNELSKEKNCSINDVFDNMLNEYVEQILDRKLIEKKEAYQKTYRQKFTTHEEIMKEVYGEDI